MSDLFWLTDEQVERLRPFFPKSHGKPSTRRSSTRGLPWLLGKNGRRRSTCSSVSQNRSLIWVSSRSLNQMATLTSMGPDPSAPSF